MGESPELRSLPANKPWVPHISLVFCEMWDTTNVDHSPPKDPFGRNLGNDRWRDYSWPYCKLLSSPDLGPGWYGSTARMLPRMLRSRGVNWAENWPEFISA